MCVFSVSVCHTEDILFLTCNTHYCILPQGSLSHAGRLQLAMILSFCSSSCLLIYVFPLFLLPFLSLTPLKFTLLVLDALIKPACGLFDAVLMTFYFGVFSPRAKVRLALSPPLMLTWVWGPQADVLVLWWGNGGPQKPSPWVAPPLPSPLLPTPFQPAKPWARRSRGASSP